MDTRISCPTGRPYTTLYYVHREQGSASEIEPTEAPTITEDVNLEDEAAKPTYTEETPAVTTTDSTPKTGDMKDGKMYVEGFGWITDEGEGSGVVDDQMYENGNKVGIME